MLTITKPGPNRVDIALEGGVDWNLMKWGLDDLIEKSEGVEHGRMLYRIPEFALPTMGGFFIELSRLPKLFGLLARFDRCAVLSDASWIRTTAEVEGALIPGLEIRSFALDDAEAAEAWLAEDGA
jgi:hypothetical protein